MNLESQTPAPPAPFSGAKIALGVFALAVLVALGALAWKAHTLEKRLEQLASVTDAKLGSVRQYAMMSADVTRKSFESVQLQMEQLRALATAESAKARAAALKRAEAIESDLRAREQEAQERARELNRQLEALQQTASAKFDNLNADVNSVKTEVRNTKSELDNIIKDLRSVRGDLGVQSGLIATNARELAALKELGARNYFEFDITKKANRVRVGDVVIKLNKTDTKANRYSIEIVADDRRVEKKDRTLNEPVQFYVGRTRALYEIVVNEIQRDRIVGYLATPKVLTALR